METVKLFAAKVKCGDVQMSWDFKKGGGGGGRRCTGTSICIWI